MQIVANGDNLHEISNSVFWENKKNIVSLLSAEFAHTCNMVRVNIDFCCISFYYLNYNPEI